MNPLHKIALLINHRFLFTWIGLHYFSLGYMVMADSQSQQMIPSELLQVQVIFRHGDRTPFYHYPKNPYPLPWPDGLAQLTKEGKIQAYNLGKFLRERYTGFLGTKYYPTEIYVQCSEFDRTVMTALTVLAGTFPPNSDDRSSQWNSHIHWQPIPVFSIPAIIDHKIGSHHCPKYSRLSKEFTSNSQYIKDLYETNQDLLKFLRDHTGEELGTGPEHAMRDFRTLAFVHDTLYCQHAHGFILPKWTEGLFPEKFNSFGLLQFQLPGATNELLRLWGGPLATEIVQNMEGMIAKVAQRHRGGGTHKISLSTRSKMYLYSGHDSTVAKILHVLGLFNGNPHIPPYAGALIIELHKRPDPHTTFFVKVVYRNTSEHPPFLDPVEMSMPHCPDPCTFEKFNEMLSPYIAGDFVKECRDQEVQSPPVVIVPKSLKESLTQTEDEQPQNCPPSDPSRDTICVGSSTVTSVGYFFSHFHELYARPLIELIYPHH